jgi:YggT family protein
MLFIIGLAVKFLIGVILLHSTMTPQELHFNPLGKMVASITNPVYMNVFKMTKKRTDTLAPVFILILIVLYALILTLIGIGSIFWSFYYSFTDVLRFLLLFYLIAILVGSTVNRFGNTAYSTFFYRLALPWVKMTRSVINLPGNTVIVPTIIVLFVVFIALVTALQIGFSFLNAGSFNPVVALKGSIGVGIAVLIQLITMFTWLIIIRALMSWVSPDPRNGVVQFVTAMTEPVIEPLRKVIPTLGFIDISPIVLLVLLYFVKIMLSRLIFLL